jgi:glycosyltransferase involved in cell wall biosynthesis
VPQIRVDPTGYPARRAPHERPRHAPGGVEPWTGDRVARPSLLYLAHEFPIPVSGAARLRTFNWVLHFARHFDVTFVASSRDAVLRWQQDALAPYCARLHVLGRREHEASLAGLVTRLRAQAGALVHGTPPEAWILQHGEARQLLRRLRIERRFDLVFAERWTWGPEALAAAPRVVLDATALEAERLEAARLQTRNPIVRLHLRLAAARIRAHESRALAGASLTLSQNPETHRVLRDLCGEDRTLALPSGLCTRYFAPRRTHVDPGKVLFFGPLSSPAQRDALLHLQRELMPRLQLAAPHARLTVVGESPIPELEREARAGEIHFTGPLEDVRVELWRGTVAAAPLRFGRGSRARLAQLLALGIPVVASPGVARSLDLRSGDGLLVAEDDEQLVAALGQVLLDSSLRGDLARRGRQTALAKLSIAATYDRVSVLLAQEMQ